MYPIPSTEKLVETRICKHCQTDFPITDKDLEFYDRVSPTFADQKYQIPAPMLCPDCRQQRRTSFRNTRSLYKRKCNATGKDIISMFSPDKPFKVYEQQEWLSDHWDAITYGREFDFSRTFFEQFQELHREVPRKSLNNDSHCENSPFINCAAGCKDSYLIFDSADAEKCLYASRLLYTNLCVDCLIASQSERCYECCNIAGCSSCFYSSACTGCSNSQYMDNCKWCHFCFGCANLFNREYCIYNEPFDKLEYEKRLKKILSEKSRSELKADFADFQAKSIHQWLDVKSVENTIGDHVQNAKNSMFVFDASDIERIKYAQYAANSDNVYDANNICCNTSFCYEISSGGLDMFNCLFCNDVWPSVSGAIYCDFCSYSFSLFGCVGIRNKQYCILNKQYTKEEYEVLVPRIIEHMRKTGEWGEFFPSSMSPFWYNETVAATEYYPLSRQEVTEKCLSQNGKPIFNWSDYEAPFPKVEKVIPGARLPERIEEIPDDILNWAIECEVTGKPFRIIKQELEFYRKHGLPVPRRHPDQRHMDRIALRNPRSLFERNCNQCGERMITTYAPNRPETVYCEACYHQETI